MVKDIVLFLNDCNSHESENPYATLIEFEDYVTNELMKQLEYRQLGVGRRGGSLSELLADLSKLGIKYKEISNGRFWDYKETLRIYRLISGNY